jgi:hypothetical protein
MSVNMNEMDVMPFGRRKGRRIRELDDRYIQDLWRYGRLEGPVRDAIRQEMERRAYEQHETRRTQGETAHTVKRFRVPVSADGRLGHLEFLGEALAA